MPGLAAYADPPAATGWDTADLLDVEMHQLVGVSSFVVPDRWVDRGQTVQAVTDQDLVHRGAGYVPPESELEAMVLDLLARYGFSPPDRQVQLPWMVGTNERVDFAYCEQRLIIECDFERDRRRDNEAMLAGWRVLRVTWDQVVGDEPGVVSMLRRGLDRAAA